MYAAVLQQDVAGSFAALQGASKQLGTVGTLPQASAAPSALGTTSVWV